jgi:hypothetical protein
MATQPTRPGTEIDPETEKIVLERLSTLERAKETAEDADVVMKQRLFFRRSTSSLLRESSA